MKKIIFILSALLFVNLCNAQVLLEVNNENEYRLKKDKYELSRVTAEPQAVKFINGFDKAISSPYKFIPFEKHKETIRMIGLFKALKVVSEEGLIFNPEENKILFSEKGYPEEEESSYLLVFGMLSLILMAISNIFIKEDKMVFNRLIISLTLLGGLAVACICFFVAFVSAILAILVLAIPFYYGNSLKIYKMSVIGYYFFMVAYFALMFLGL